MSVITLAHIVNPVAVNETSDLFIAQPVTFETMKAAAEAAGKNVKVELYAAFYPGDEAVVPGYFTRLAPLKTSIQQMGTFEKPRKLPLLKEILDRLAERSSADYFIYTNVDIAVMPEFYTEVAKILKKGYDGFVINRRTIGNRYSDIKDIPLMIAEAKSGGKKHPGYDCFIFKREAYEKYMLGNACIGVNWIGRVFVSNIMAFSTKFKVFENRRLTFHIGDERIWLKHDYDDYTRYNENQLINILEHLNGLGKLKNGDMLEEFYTFHLNNLQSQGPVPGEIVAQNSPSYRLPGKPGEIYHTDFRGSESWEGYDKQLIRQDPIFITGYPRSGTTLLQALTATQENIYSFHETHFFTRVRPLLKVKEDKVLGEVRDKWESFFNDIIFKTRERVPFSKNAEKHTRELVKNNALSPKMFYETIVIDNLINQVDINALGRIRWMEKTPFNELFLDVIFRFYPSAKVIYAIRHPEKAILSRRKHFNLDREENRWPVKRHINEWLRSVDEMEKSAKRKPGSILVVRLEDIAASPAKEMRKVCDFLDIDFEKEKLKNYKKIAKTFYHPWEYWKENTSKDISGKIALRKEVNLPSDEKVILKELANEKMEKYGYTISSRDTKNKLKFPPVPGSKKIRRIFKQIRRGWL